MDATMFQALVRVESNTLPREPQRVASRTSYPAIPPQGGKSIELMSVEPLRATPATSSPPSGPSTPPGERDLEMSSDGPGTPGEPTHAVEALPSLNDPPMNKYRFIICCTQNMTLGLTDAAPGALIPYLEKYYDIGYAIVSLLFIGNALGFIAAAPFVDAVRHQLGRAWTSFLGNIIAILGFIPLLVKAPWAAIVVGYFFVGFGFALNLATSNVFLANLKNGTVLLGGMHGGYGIGGVIGPLIATAIVTSVGPDAWNLYYIITIAVLAANALGLLWSFWGYEKELSNMAEPTSTTATTTVESQTSPPAIIVGQTAAIVPPLSSSSPLSEPPRTGMAAMLQALKSRVVILGAAYIFAYQGAEVSISGWVISFLITARGGDPAKVGNVTSGFWGGITLGRFVLSPVGARVGEKRFVYFLMGGATIFQLLVWLVPNIVGEAVSLAIVGLLLGPIYPCATSVFTRGLSRADQVSGLGLISAFGSSGGAVAPFTTGLLAQAVGPFVLHPVAIALFAVMVACWFAIPITPKRKE